MGRIICELERIYNIKKGNNQHSSNGTNLTQEELAARIGIDLNTYKRDKKLIELIPELQDIVQDGNHLNENSTMSTSKGINVTEQCAVTQNGGNRLNNVQSANQHSIYAAFMDVVYFF